MDNCQRVDPPLIADERETLIKYLDYQRETILCKLQGLSEEQVRQTHPPSSLSLLGIVKHLTNIERSWFRRYMGDEPTPPEQARNPADPDEDFRIEPDEHTQDIIDGYRSECARSNEIITAHSMDDLARPYVEKPRPRTLRWIAIHMLEETARHAGHADLIRESIDGKTGE